MTIKAKVEFSNFGTATNCFKYARDLKTAIELCEAQVAEIETNPGNTVTRVYVLNKGHTVWCRENKVPTSEA